jgi:hypothetical protein
MAYKTEMGMEECEGLGADAVNVPDTSTVSEVVI